MLAEKRQLASSQGLVLFEWRGHDPAYFAHGGRRCWGPLRVIAPTPGDSITRVEPIHRVGKVAHEITAPQFAIREHTQTKFLLLLQYPRDMVVLQGCEFSQGNVGPACLK
jgi:hypothetical protein